MASICQSSANIYYQSDKSFLTALQLFLLTYPDLTTLIHPSLDSSSDRIGFQFYGADGKRKLVTVTKTLPKPKQKVPGCATEDVYLSVQASEYTEPVQFFLALLEKAIVQHLC